MNQAIPKSHTTQKATWVLRFYLALVIVGGLLTLWSLLRIPMEARNAVILGLSKERLAMAAGILAVMSAAAGAMILSWAKKPLFAACQEKLGTKIQNRITWGWINLILALGLLIGSYLILLTPEITEPFTLAYFERLYPLLFWFTILCGQTLVLLPLLRDGFDLNSLKPRSPMAYQIAMLLGLFLILWLLIALTGLGITATDAGAGWNYLGTPVVETQAFLAWGMGMVYILLALWGENHPDFLGRMRKLKFLRADLIFSILIWAIALVSWNNVPLTENWFAAPPRVPNQAFYPNSDASLYDTTGQSLLTGMGFKTHNAPFAIRPMYAFFLATLHAIGGPDYEPIIWMQVAVLALIPVLLYWITRELHSRVSGLIAAALIIFREANAIILGNAITTSHAKLLMSDLPTTLGVMLFVLMMIRWLQNPGQRQTLTLIAGGAAGAFMLIRPEFGVLLPFVGLTALLQLIRQPKIWFKGMVLITCGTLLMLIPWVWRNYQITGTIFLDSPHYRADLFAVRYREYDTETQPSEENRASTATPEQPPATAAPVVEFLPAESSEEFAERMAQEAAQFAQNNPWAVAAFITNHFFNSQVQSVLYLPGTWRLPDRAVGFMGHKEAARFWEECCSTDNYIRRLPFWFKWDGTLPRQSILFVLVNLSLISVGLVSAWKQQRFVALLPLAANLGYTLINAAVRNSGGRYILAVDWVGILYYAIGLGQLSLWLVAYFRGDRIPAKGTGEIRNRSIAADRSLWRGANLWAAGAILLFGCLLPLSEIIVPNRYPAELFTERYHAILQSTELLPAEKDILANWQASGGLVVQGRALYPRFHSANNGEVGDTIRAFMPAPYPKINFYLVGPFNHGIVLPQQLAPAAFLNGADVLVFGCNGEAYFEALVVAVYDQAGNLKELLRRDPFPEAATCPMPAP